MCPPFPALAAVPADLVSLDTAKRIGWHPGRDAQIRNAVRLESLTCELNSFSARGTTNMTGGTFSALSGNNREVDECFEG
jgi:hypothetical protein